MQHSVLRHLPLLLAALLLLLAATDVQAQTDYTTRCNCIVASSSSYYCQKWTCDNTVDPASCFAGEELVSVLAADGVHVTQKAMAELRVGDRVRAVEASGELSWSPVIAWLHRDTERLQSFLELHWEVLAEEPQQKGRLVVTPEHLVFVAAPAATAATAKNDDDSADFQWSQTRLAGALSVGDELLVVLPGGDQPVRARVSRVQEVLKRGVWAPLTSSGSLVVSGTVASAYASLNHQPLAHASFAPLRWWHSMFGGSQQLQQQQQTTQQEQAEVHWYARGLISLAQWLSVPLEGFRPAGASVAILSAPLQQHVGPAMSH